MSERNIITDRDVIKMMDKLAIELTGNSDYAIIVPTRILLQAYVINRKNDLLDPEFVGDADHTLSMYAFDMPAPMVNDFTWIEVIHNKFEPIRKSRERDRQTAADCREEGWPGRWSRNMAKSVLSELSRVYLDGDHDAWEQLDPIKFLGMVSLKISETNRNLAKLAEALSDRIYGDEHGWENVPFDDFVKHVCAAMQKPTHLDVSDHISKVQEYIVNSEMGGTFDPDDSYAETHDILADMLEKALDEEEIMREQAENNQKAAESVREVPCEDNHNCMPDSARAQLQLVKTDLDEEIDSRSDWEIMSDELEGYTAQVAAFVGEKAGVRAGELSEDKFRGRPTVASAEIVAQVLKDIADDILDDAKSKEISQNG